MMRDAESTNKLNIFRSGGRIQYTVKDGHQQELESIERAYRSHQHDGGQ